MGNVDSCGGCFSWLGGGGSKPVPDSSPSSRTSALNMKSQCRTMDEALALTRPDQGSFMPSPGSAAAWVNIGKPFPSPGSSAAWASPMPRDASGYAVASDYPVEFEIEIETMDKPQGSMGIDMDIPLIRMASSRDVDHSLPKLIRGRYEAEMLLCSPGALPKPMSADQREGAIRSLLPTATFQMLSKVDPFLLTASDANGQALRRQMARGATCVFICAGLQGKRFTFERAASLGMKVVVIEHHDSWAKTLVDEGVIAKFLPVDFSLGGEQVFKDALAHIKTLGQDGKTGSADGIVTFVELAVPLVSRLAEAMGLPGHHPAAVDDARDKHKTRSVMKKAGLPTPLNAIIRSEAEVEAAGKEVGFPAVLKPICGAASLGVKKVCHKAELLSTYQEIVAELRTLVVSSGALVKGDPNATMVGVEAENIIDLTVLMEQYLDGPEVDVDVIMSEGEWRYAAVADNGPTLEPYFNETWAVCPSLLPKDTQYELRKLAIDSVKCLGFTSGIFHVECKATSKGPQLIEVNSRMGGGQVHECNLRTWGVDLVEETLFVCLGIPSRPPVPKMPLTACAYCYVNAPKSGTAGDLSKLESIAKREGVVWAKPLAKPGSKVVGPEDGLPTWLADLFVIRRTPKEALAFLKAIEAEHPVNVV